MNTIARTKVLSITLFWLTFECRLIVIKDRERERERERRKILEKKSHPAPFSVYQFFFKKYAEQKTKEDRMKTLQFAHLLAQCFSDDHLPEVQENPFAELVVFPPCCSFGPFL